MSNNQELPVERLLEGLNQHSELLSLQDRIAELRERGIDVDSFLKEAHSIITEHQKEHRLAWMKVADQKLESLQKKESSVKSWIAKTAAEIRAAFAQYISAPARQKTIAFRNKSDLSVEDMARILDDHERLKTEDDDNKGAGNTQ